MVLPQEHLHKKRDSVLYLPGPLFLPKYCKTVNSPKTFPIASRSIQVPHDLSF